MKTFATNARKFVVAATGAAGIAVSEGLLNGTNQRWVSGAIAIVSAFLTYYIPNG